MAAWTGALAETGLGSDAVGIVDEIRALEELACAARARQARLAAELDRVDWERIA